MARNGSGTYDLPGADFTNGTLADADEVMAKLDDIATALTASIAKDGQTTPTAALPMGGFNHTNVGVATARTHYARASQIADGALTYGGVAGGTADALTIAPSPAITAYVIGQVFQFKVGASANTGAATLNINSVGAGAITWPDGSALAAGELPANSMAIVVVQATTPVFHLLAQAIPRSTFTSTDAGAAAGPTINLFRNSASPAASDVLGEVSFTGKDSGAGTDTYARIYADIVDATAASEDGRLNIETKIAGTAALRGYVQHGLVMGAPTGTDKGAGTGNFEGLYIGGATVGKPLATLTASSSAALDFTLVDSTLYAGYWVVFENILPATDGVGFRWLASVDGGSNFLTTGTYMTAALGVAASTVTGVNAATAAEGAIAGALSNAAGEGLSGWMRVTSGGAVAYGTSFLSQTRHVDNGGGSRMDVASAANATASAVNAYRWVMSSGNIASGTIRVWGLLK